MTFKMTFKMTSKLNPKQLAISTLMLLGLLGSNVQAEDSPYHIGDLQPGPHKVGFKVFHEFDHSRTFRIHYHDNGTINRNSQPRPMQVAIWYPAEASDKPMDYAEYVRVNATREVFYQLSDEEIAQKDQRYTKMQGMMGQLDEDKLRKNLTMKMQATRDAKLKDGKFPVILYAQRENRGIYINYQLAEYLASHGYVVATTPAKAKTDNAPAFNFWNQDGIEAGIDDLQFVKQFVRKFDNADSNNLAVVGYGFGSTTALGLAINDPTIRAVVSWGGIIGSQNPSIRPALDSIDYFTPKNVQTPLLHLGVNGFGDNKPRAFGLMQSAIYADTYQLQFKTLNPIAFGAAFNLEWIRTLKDPSKFDIPAMDKGYEIASRYTLNFFDHYLKDKASGQQFLHKTLDEQGISEDFASYQSREGLLPPPTEDYFFDVFYNDGPAAAQTLFDRVKKNDPQHPVFSEQRMSGLAFNLLNQELFERAEGALRLIHSGYPEESWIHAGLAEVYAKTKRPDLAKKAWQKANELEVPQWLLDRVGKVMATL